MESTLEIPVDPALPALAAIRSNGLAAALPEMRLKGPPDEFRLVGYTSGGRATIEVRIGDRHFGVKAYAKDPTPEVRLYRALEDAGLADDARVCVPRLLGWNPALRLIAVSWVPGRALTELMKQGEGRRAGTLGAAVLRRFAALPVRLGRAFGPGELLFDVGKWVSRMVVFEPPLGLAAEKVANHLLARLPEPGRTRLLHGTLYTRHILDTGDRPGVIDWQRHAQGPIEFDAATFLAKVSRFASRGTRFANEVVQAEEAFWAGTKRLLDRDSLAWYRAAVLLRQAAKPFQSARKERLMTPDERVSAVEEARGLVANAARLAEAIP